MKLKFISQKNRNSGCGVACVAMLAGVSYSKAEKALFPDNSIRGRYTQYSDIQRGLLCFGVRFDNVISRERSWPKIRGISVVKCGVTQDGNWHWLIYDGAEGIIYDPLKRGPTVPDGRSRKISSHLRVFP